MRTLPTRPTVRRVSGLAALALTMSVGLAACGDDADSDTDTGSSSGGSSETSDDASSDPAESETETASDAEPFGPACDQIPTEGAGSLEGMTVDPVATAAGNNPLLSELVGAVGLVPGLADTLNNTDNLTVFAPYNDAFAAVPADTMMALTSDPEGALAPVLGYHVLTERLEPDEIAGTYPTFAGPEVTVEGDSSGMTVGANGTEANVLCGGIQTANATVYVIDAVMIPPAS